MSSDLKGKRISILGVGRSGIAAAKLAATSGADVFISDSGKKEKMADHFKEFQSLGIEMEFENHSQKVLESELIILSPGIPGDIPILLEAEKRSISVISEIEFASRFIKGQMIAVTGSNGKSTTTTLIGELIKSQGIKCHISGNIGEAVSDFVLNEENRKNVFVIELSSFQLEKIIDFHPRIAVLLNLSPDHLDRYRSVGEYYGAKKNLFKNMDKNDLIIANYEDERVKDMVNELPSPKQYFSLMDEHCDAFCDGREIYLKNNRFSVSEMGIHGPHNWQNSMAALLCVNNLIEDINLNKISSTLSQFTGLSHRLEQVRTLEDVNFINDSKATTLESMQVALQSFQKKVILLAGGKNKGADFSKVSGLIRQKVAAVIALGDAGNDIQQAWNGIVPITKTRDFKFAVEEAFRKARDEHADVLLSPACASFDMFRDYEDRGNQFKQLVEML